MSEKKVAINLAEYKGVPVKKRDTVVTERELSAELERARTFAAKTEDKPGGSAEMGDQVVIDFTAYIDGMPLDGGGGRDYPIILGSHSFVPGFEEQLVGAKVGDQVDVKVRFPEHYHEARYAGREARFEVTIHDLRATHVPELSDEVVARISPCSTVDEFRDYVAEEIRTYKEKQNREERESEVLTKIVEGSEIFVPEELVEERAARLRSNLISQLESSGTTLETYLDYNNLSEETYDKYNRINALNMLRGQAAMSEIARLEGLSCSEQELNEELYLMARNYQTDMEELRGMLGEEGIEMVREDILDKKALDFAVEHSVETEEAADVSGEA